MAEKKKSKWQPPVGWDTTPPATGGKYPLRPMPQPNSWQDVITQNQYGPPGGTQSPTEVPNLSLFPPALSPGSYPQGMFPGYDTGQKEHLGSFTLTGSKSPVSWFPQDQSYGPGTLPHTLGQGGDQPPGLQTSQLPPGYWDDPEKPEERIPFPTRSLSTVGMNDSARDMISNALNQYTSNPRGIGGNSYSTAGGVSAQQNQMAFFSLPPAQQQALMNQGVMPTTSTVSISGGVGSGGTQLDSNHAGLLAQRVQAGDQKAIQHVLSLPGSEVAKIMGMANQGQTVRPGRYFTGERAPGAPGAPGGPGGGFGVPMMDQLMQRIMGDGGAAGGPRTPGGVTGAQNAAQQRYGQANQAAQAQTRQGMLAGGADPGQVARAAAGTAAGVEQGRRHQRFQEEKDRLQMALQAMGIGADLAARLAQAQAMGQGQLPIGFNL